MSVCLCVCVCVQMSDLKKKQDFNSTENDLCYFYVEVVLHRKGKKKTIYEVDIQIDKLLCFF